MERAKRFLLAGSLTYGVEENSKHNKTWSSAQRIPGPSKVARKLSPAVVISHPRERVGALASKLVSAGSTEELVLAVGFGGGVPTHKTHIFGGFFEGHVGAL